jgi:hypothetical protein
MELKEIVFRDGRLPVEQDEMLFVIKRYIKARKDVDINPEIDTSFGGFNVLRELTLATKMFIYAVGWFRENGIK